MTSSEIAAANAYMRLRHQPWYEEYMQAYLANGRTHPAQHQTQNVKQQQQTTPVVQPKPIRLAQKDFPQISQINQSQSASSQHASSKTVTRTSMADVLGGHTFTDDKGKLLLKINVFGSIAALERYTLDSTHMRMHEPHFSRSRGRALLIRDRQSPIPSDPSKRKPVSEVPIGCTFTNDEGVLCYKQHASESTHPEVPELYLRMKSLTNAHYSRTLGRKLLIKDRVTPPIPD